MCRADVGELYIPPEPVQEEIIQPVTQTNICRKVACVVLVGFIVILLISIGVRIILEIN